eukprot:2363043-Rhodomonas_salina.2
MPGTDIPLSSYGCLVLTERGAVLQAVEARLLSQQFPFRVQPSNIEGTWNGGVDVCSPSGGTSLLRYPVRHDRYSSWYGGWAAGMGLRPPVLKCGNTVCYQAGKDATPWRSTASIITPRARVCDGKFSTLSHRLYDIRGTVAVLRVCYAMSVTDVGCRCGTDWCKHSWNPNPFGLGGEVRYLPTRVLCYVRRRAQLRQHLWSFLVVIPDVDVRRVVGFAVPVPGPDPYPPTLSRYDVSGTEIPRCATRMVGPTGVLVSSTPLGKLLCNTWY